MTIESSLRGPTYMKILYAILQQDVVVLVSYAEVLPEGYPLEL